MKILAAILALVTCTAFRPYDADSFEPGISGNATGFFHVEKHSDGRWWAIDPLGRGFVPMGVDLVRSAGFKSRATGESAYKERILQKYSSIEAWRTNTVARLCSWGFNMLGARSDRRLEQRGLAHVISLSMGLSMCTDEDDDSLWICPYEKHPSRAFPNVFDPEFAVRCDRIAEKTCAPNRNDPWLFGYYTDNELAWWGRGAKGSCDGLFDAVMAKPDGHSAKKALQAFLADRNALDNVSDNVKLDFLRLVARRYFETVCSAIRRHDPNHMVLGSRFAGPDGAHDAVWEIAGRHCDAVSFNFYAWADIDTRAVRISSDPFSASAAAEIASRHAAAKRPLFITEWSFPSLDSSLPCTVGAGQRFHTQKERAEACELFARTVLSCPTVIGYNYFMWLDEPADGLHEQFLENCNYGLVNDMDEPYAEVTSVFARIQSEAGKMRTGRPPNLAPRSEAGGTSHECFVAKLPCPHESGGTTFKRDGDSYTITTRGGLVLSGRVGDGPLFSRVSLNGRALGCIGIMADFADELLRWRQVSRFSNVDFGEWSGWGKMSISGTALDKSGADAFTVDAEVLVHPDRPYFTVNLTRVTNISGQAVDLKAIYFSQTPDFLSDVRLDAPGRVPNLWKAPRRDAWLDGSDGRWWGGTTQSAACSLFRYYITKKDEVMTYHSDIRFNFPACGHADSLITPQRIRPGESFCTRGQCWALFAGGEGGSGEMTRGLSSILPDS